MYIQYIVNVSENQVDTSKDTIRLKKGVTLCFPKGGIRGDHVLLHTPAQINRLDKTMAFSTTGLVNVHVIFVFRHGKHLM